VKPGGAPLVAALSLGAATLFWWPLLAGGPLSGNDWSSHHFHYFDWVRTCLREWRTLPLYMSDAAITPNFLANAESPLLSPLVPLLLVLGTSAYLKLLVVLFTAAGLGGGYALLRDLQAPAPVAAIFAALFAGGGFVPAHIGVGHPWALGVLLLPALLCLYRRAALGSNRALWLGAALAAASIGGGQHQPYIWQGFFLSAYALLWALRERAWFPLARFGAWLAATIGLSAPKLLPMFAEFADYAPFKHTPGLPASLLLTSLAGWGQRPDFTPEALALRFGAGWWEYAFYVGPLGLAGLLVGIAAARRERVVLAIGALFLLLALAPPSSALDLWGALRELPLLRSQRSPSRFLVLALFAFGVVAALGLGRLWEAAARRRPRAAVAFGFAAALLLGADLQRESRVWQREALGPAIAPREHRPTPFAFASEQGAQLELIEFHPNRLVYRVSTPAAARVIFPVRWGKSRAEWTAAGWFPIRDEEEGNLAVEVPAGERTLELRYRPALSGWGLAAFALTLCALAASFRKGKPHVG
jgi:hypothetical protein